MAASTPDLTPVFLPDMLRATAARFGDRVAVDFLDAHTTYADLWTEVQALARGLQHAGLKKGGRVGLMLPNCPDYIRFYFATLLAGGVVVNINPLYAPHELKHILDDSTPDFVVTLNLKRLVDKLTPHLPAEKLIISSMNDQLPAIKSLAFRLFKAMEIACVPDGALEAEHLLQMKGAPTPVTVDVLRDIAVLQYTGGTTGTSKAAMLSHANLSVNAKQCRAWFHPMREGAETALGILPFFHAFALTTVVNLSILLGTTIIALPRFDLKQTLKTIHRKKPTVFPAVPTIYTAINAAPDLKKYDLRSINFCVAGGAPLPVEVREEFMRNTGCTLVEGYGLSEASPVVAANPIIGANKGGSIGLPMPESRILLLSLDDHVTEVPRGEKGELCVTGPQVMLGYWNKPLETANVMVNGALRTGDVATLDADGYIYIVDRIKDMILCGGYNVYPRNVEEAVYKHTSVEECVCAGITDAYRGESVKIWVKLRDGHSLSEGDLRTFLKDYLSPIEMPKFIEFRTDPLPKTLIGKLSRKDLLAQEAAQEKKGA
jgi:long-chain acyl-CoA synthetase